MSDSLYPDYQSLKDFPYSVIIQQPCSLTEMGEWNDKNIGLFKVDWTWNVRIMDVSIIFSFKDQEKANWFALNWS